MYFSSCSRLCSTSAGVRVKIFFGGNAGTTLLPYSFLICGYSTRVVKVRLQDGGLRNRYFSSLSNTIKGSCCNHIQNICESREIMSSDRTDHLQHRDAASKVKDTSVLFFF